MIWRGLLATGVAAGMVLTAAPAVAQGSTAGSTVSQPIQDCAEIQKKSARLACYDEAAGRSRPSKGSARSVARPLRPGVPATPVQSFGMNTKIRQQRHERPTRPEEPHDLTAQVASARPHGYGMWLISLAGGASWQMTENPGNFQPPNPGSTVRIRKGVAGSFLMYVGRQPSVRVVRVR